VRLYEPVRRELLDELLAGYSKPEDITGPEGLLKRLTGARDQGVVVNKSARRSGFKPTNYGRVAR